MKEIYLDSYSTTKVKKETAKKALLFMEKEYGNPSSLHALGEKSLEAMNSTREKLAKEINCKPWEIIFTSGTTEAGMAILSVNSASPISGTLVN